MFNLEIEQLSIGAQCSICGEEYSLCTSDSVHPAFFCREACELCFADLAAEYEAHISNVAVECGREEASD